MQVMGAGEALLRPTIIPAAAFGLAVSAFALGRPLHAAEAPRGGERVDFATDIKPILTAKCTECHGGVQAAGGISFIYRDNVIGAEGESGLTVVEPGDADASELFYRITSEDEFDQMPPPEAHAPLSPAEVDLMRRWIEQGADWTDHWAFEPPVAAVAPTTAFDGLASGEIDRFLFSRLEVEGLQPSPPAAPGRVLRRLSLAITGLPPSLDELDAFEAACAEDADAAVAAAVDDLLARPTYGERWASVWLDLVRYADSAGLGQDQKREIWAYRDWVVDAFNDDMPFDQFTIKQLAGDLLPDASYEDLIATACQRNTQNNDEGGTDDEEFRVEAVLDRVNTTWQTWGSTTFGCVQCHDHPYDPLRHDEYYEFAAFFNNTADSDLRQDLPRLPVAWDRSRRDELHRLRGRVLALQTARWEVGSALRDATSWRPTTELAVSSNNGMPYAVLETEHGAEFVIDGTPKRKTHTVVEIAAAQTDGLPLTALRLTVRPENPETSIHTAEWGFQLAGVAAAVIDSDGGETRVDFAHSVSDVPYRPHEPLRPVGRNGAGWSAFTRINHDRQLVLVPVTPVTLGDGQTLRLVLPCDYVAQDSHPLIIKRGRVAWTDDPRWSEYGRDGSEEFDDAVLKSLRDQIEAIPHTSVPVMAERPAPIARPTHVFIRGNRLDVGDRVSPDLPGTLSGYGPRLDGTPDRLDMARWWASPDHPLTSRVFVNRVWKQLFGVGLVRTLEDFGSSGEKPSHP
ncbi:MAG: DUF1549 domain-containing protein, partial [Planctomycetota bacterium]